MPTAPVDYQALFHTLPGSFLLLAADGTILDNSDRHEASSMLPRAQAQDRYIFDAYPGAAESQQRLLDSLDRVRQTMQPDTMPLLRYDLERPAAQGGGTEERYWQITHHPVLGAQGELAHILQTSQDVTAQHHVALAAAEADRALADAQQQTSFLLESLPVLIWTADAQGERDFFNARWLAFTGHPAEAQLGSEWLGSVHPDDRERVAAAWQQAVASGEPYQAEYRLRRHDGQYRWLLVRAQPRRAAPGQPVSMWAGGALDIHEQRQLVQELLEANEQQAALSAQAHELYQQAESQRENYHSLFMQAPALISILRGPQHRVEFVNPPYQAMFPDRQFVGRLSADIFPELQGQGIFELLDSVYATGDTYHGDEQPVQVRDDATGQMREGYFNFIYKRYEEAGQPAGLMVFAFEVTEALKARQELERLRGEGPAAA